MTVKMRMFLILASVSGVLALSISPACAEALSPWFRLSSASVPGDLEVGETSEIALDAVNVGDAAVNANATTPVILTDVLPEHVTPQKGSSVEILQEKGGAELGLEKECEVGEVRRVTCTFDSGTLPPFHQIELRIRSSVEKGAATGEVNEASISGGGAPSAEIRHPITVSSAPTPFGVEDYEPVLEEAGGAPDTRAGSHPFQYTTTFELKAGFIYDPNAGKKVVEPTALAKDVVVKLPSGLVGDPTAYPRCSLAQFLTVPHGGANLCPSDTILGVSSVTIYEPKNSGAEGQLMRVVPVFNIEPGPGEAARFAYSPDGVPVFLGASVRTGEDYGVTVNVEDVSQTVGFLKNTVTFWGVPGEASHNDARGAGCLEEQDASEVPCEPDAPAASSPPPFLTLPTSCSGEPLPSVAETDSWSNPGVMISPSPDPSEPMSIMDGCDLLPFHAEIIAVPDVKSASTPSGLSVDVHVPQEGQLAPKGRSQSNIKNIQVTLPAGVELNPSAANGLEACTGDSNDDLGVKMGVPGNEIGFKGEETFPSEPGVEQFGFTPRVPGSVTSIEAGEFEELQPDVNFCPNASKIANVEITTPLLPNPVKGFVYLASPQNFKAFPPENPFQTHVAMYIVAEDPVSGSLVKLPGRVELGGEPGVEGLAPAQIRSTFADNPQLPFEDAKLDFFGGERAPLSTPAHCGIYTTEAVFEPWSNIATDRQVLHSESTFEITSGPNGGPCPGSSLSFGPSLSSETTNINAGSFSPLSTTLSRPTGEQNIESVTLHYPPGLSGLLSDVELCPEPQANDGTCGPNSQVGETIVSIGVGGDPFTVTGGKTYITGPYNGSGGCTVGEPGCAPFGLSIVNPAKAGPFDLQEGRPVVVRAKIEVNPETAALTVSTDETGAHAIPTIIEGFPLQIQHVNVLVNRNDFTFNPTNCNPTKITGEIKSAEGASAAVEDPFQVTNCAALKFAPKFAVTTSGKTSKAKGASLTTKVTEPNEPQGSQADIAKVKVELPLQLPSRLTTLQKACLARVFEADPAACPPESSIGHAVVHTPLLPVPLEGPAIFVSHGGEAFPSLTMVLQGDGVTIDLVGATHISHAGITSTTFKTVPDAPFNSFELTLPEGPYSALAANGNLCKPTTTKTVKKKVTTAVHGHKRTVTKKVKETVATTLVMPNEFVAQNGAVIKQDTTIGVTGCPKARTAKKHKKKQAKRRDKR
jgi:hypothetical protein